MSGGNNDSLLSADLTLLCLALLEFLFEKFKALTYLFFSINCGIAIAFARSRFKNYFCNFSLLLC